MAERDKSNFSNTPTFACLLHINDAKNKSGYAIVVERDIDELYVNSYNPEWEWHGMGIMIFKYAWIISQ